MRFVVLGAGAVGGVVGGRLAEHGHDVVLIARGAHHDAIADRGLTLRSPDREITLRLPVATSPAVVHSTHAGLNPERDVVLLAVKSHQTSAALDALADAGASPDLPVVCLQNGVSNEGAALRRFRRVYAVPVMAPTTHLEPGVVEAYSSPITGILDIGRFPNGTDAVADAVAAAFSSATFASVARRDVMRWKWAKLLMNLGNAAEALCGPDALRHPAGQELLDRASAEGVACLAAAGIDHASGDEDRERRGDLLGMAPIGGRRRGGGSSWQSLSRRTGDIESDHLNGEIVLLGRLHGVATPVNEVLQERAWSAARRRDPPGSTDPAELLAMAEGSSAPA